MTTQHLLFALLLGLSSAFIGVAVIDVLSKEPILNWWFKIGDRLGHKIKNNMQEERWFFRPIWGCEKCLSGQVAAWGYLFSIDLLDYSPFCHVLAVCTAVLLASIFSLIYTQLKKHE